MKKMHIQKFLVCKLIVPFFKFCAKLSAQVFKTISAWGKLAFILLTICKRGKKGIIIERISLIGLIFCHYFAFLQMTL